VKRSQTHVCVTNIFFAGTSISHTKTRKLKWFAPFMWNAATIQQQLSDTAMDAITPEQHKRLTEILKVLADGKITIEEACSLFKKWSDELDADTDKLKVFQDAVSNAEKELAQTKAETAALKDELGELGELRGV